jgi:hypothetical protein
MKKVFELIALLRRQNFFVVIAAVCVATSCREVEEKEIVPEPVPVHAIPDGAPLTADQELLNRLDQVSMILLEIYEDSLVREEVNAAIATGFYKDERILLKDLLRPEESLIYKDAAFSGRRKFAKPLFAERFRNALNSGKYLNANKFSSAGRRMSAQQTEDYFIQNNVSIYYPYSEEGRTGRITTVSSKYESDSHPGTRPYPCGDRDNPSTCYMTVTVNDDYAFSSPTHIVGLRAEPARTGQTTGTEINKVFLGWIRCTKQYDRLVSLTGNGGGSEIKVVRADGYLKLSDNQQVTSPEGVISIGSEGSIKRRDIRKGNWVRVYAIWDWNWEVDNKEQVLGIFEEDTQGEKKIEGSLTTKLTKPDNTTTEIKPIGYSITVKTQDEIIRNWNISREAFFRDGRNDQQHGFHDGWPIYDGGSPVSFTLPFEVIQ